MCADTNFGKMMLVGVSCIVAWGVDFLGLCLSPSAHVLSVTGHFLRQTLHRVGAAGWFVAQSLLSGLCLAMAAPGAYFGFLCSHPPRALAVDTCEK